jgi:hypothetical protein
MSSSSSVSRIHGPTIAEKTAIVKHAKEIFVRLCLTEPLLVTNAKAHSLKAETSLELAELFHNVITERGYENE